MSESLRPTCRARKRKPCRSPARLDLTVVTLITLCQPFPGMVGRRSKINLSAGPGDGIHHEPEDVIVLFFLLWSKLKGTLSHRSSEIQNVFLSTNDRGL